MLSCIRGGGIEILPELRRSNTRTNMNITKPGTPTTEIAFLCQQCECEWTMDPAIELNMGLSEAFGRYAIKCPNCFNLGVLREPPKSEEPEVPAEPSMTVAE